MKSTPLLAIGCALTFTCMATVSATTKDIQLPAETAVLKHSSLAGYAVATQKCGICHSADYINLQPPAMTKTQWTAEVTKMQHTYGAPIDASEIMLLGVYLASTYGDAATVSATERAMTLSTTDTAVKPMEAIGASAPAAVDVHALLDGNGCLACHAIDHKVVGPGYHDVAAKYKSDAQAQAHVEASIHAGGSGKWGPIPMPAFDHLTPEQLKALAQFVLAQ
jgi:cytochrome c551/c552